MSKQSRTQTVMRNTAFVTASSVISQCVMALAGIYLIRYLGLSLYSEYSTAMLFMGMFGIFGRLGFERIFLRECSKDNSKIHYYFSSILLLNGGLAVIAWAIALLIAYFHYDSRIFILTVILGTSLLLMSQQTISTMVFQSTQKIHITAIISLITSLSYAIAFSIAVYLKASVFVLASVHLGMNLLAFLLSYLISFRLAFPRFNLPIFKNILRLGRPFVIISIMSVIYFQAVSFVLAFLDMKEEVGIFNAAFRLFALVQLISMAVDTATSPAVYHASNEPERMVRGVKLAIRYFTVSGIFLAAIFFGRADWLIVTVFKEEFAQSALILKILAGAVAFRYMTSILQHVIYGMNQERYMMYLLSFLAVFPVVCAIIWIPRYGALAASLIFLICEIGMGLGCLIKSEILLNWPGLWKCFIWPVVAGVATGLFLFAMGAWPITGLLLSPLVFGGILLATGYYQWDEMKFLALTFVKSR
jgi:O-antigen/teichoic acid export membrane protein